MHSVRTGRSAQSGFARSRKPVHVRCYELLSIQDLVIPLYHPRCNWLEERFNCAFKAMLKKLCT